MELSPLQVTTEDTRREPAAFSSNDSCLEPNCDTSTSTSHALHMTPLASSSSAVASSMDKTTTNAHKRKNNGGSLRRSRSREIQDEESESEVWSTLNDGFRQVQSVLDRNRVLIQQVNQNHQSRIPDNMVKNVALIQELNGNISKVVSLYSDLSTNFSSVVHERNKNDGSESGRREA